MNRDGSTTDQTKRSNRSRKSRDSGLGAEFQTLIAQAGAEARYPREAQAKRLFDRGFGSGSLREYLASIPEVPKELENENDRFPLLVLVDTRILIPRQCKLIGIEFVGNSFSYVDSDTRGSNPNKVYWIRAQDGRKNNGKSVSSCRISFHDDEIGLSAYEGLALHVQNPIGLKGRGMDLSGSLYRYNLSATAYLDWLSGNRPRLSWFGGDRENPFCGPATRLKTM